MSRCGLAIAALALACSEPPTAVLEQGSVVMSQITGHAPTIVVVLADDMRPDHFTRATMPLTYAALVDSGTLYTDAHANTPVCCPSRATLLTTSYQHNHRVMNNFGIGGGISAFNNTVTLATELQSRGWLTALIGKYLNLYSLLPQPHIAPGWDEWRVPLLPGYWSYTMNDKPYDSTFQQRIYGTRAKDHLTNVLKRAARDLILRAPPDTALFLLITPLAPHEPWTAQLSDVGSCNALAFVPQLEAKVADKPAYVRALPAITTAQIARLTADWRKQCETLKGLDRLVHEIVAALRTSGRIDNAWIVFTADNGYMMGEHRLFERKHSLYATPIPLVIRGAGQTAPAVEHGIVSMVDVSATIRRAAGLTPVQGNALDLTLPNDVLIENMVVTPANEHFTALRTDQWLYAEYPAGSTSGGPFFELYDLTADPHLLANKASYPAYAAQLQTMAGRLAAARLR